MLARLTLVAFVAIALVMPGDASAGSDWSLDTYKKDRSQSDWEGFAVGTSYKQTTVSKHAMGEHKQVVTETLMKITDDAHHIKVETEMAGRALPATTKTESRKKKTTFDLKEIGKEDVTVEGQAYPCKKMKGMIDDDGSKEETTLWVSDKHGVLKWTAVIPGERGMQDMNSVGTVTKLEATHKIGDQSFEGREIKMEVGEMGTMTSFITLDAPVLNLWQKGKMKFGGHEMERNVKITAITIKK